MAKVVEIHRRQLGREPMGMGRRVQEGDAMSRQVILTGKAVVSFRKVYSSMTDDEIEYLRASNDLREAQIDEDDLLSIEWIHDDVDMQVTP
jgi:hypothetical protein